jgi:stress-induced morphogen
MTLDQIKQRIENLGPETWVNIQDLTGTKDHWQATIVSPAFEGKLMIEQHRMIYQLFQKEIDSGELHALSLKTYTPAQYERVKL